jgi:hypothetical protein
MRMLAGRGNRQVGPHAIEVDVWTLHSRREKKKAIPHMTDLTVDRQRVAE